MGDLFFLKLQPYRQRSLFRRPSQKMAGKFYGPFPIQQRIGKGAYKLQLPPGSRIHPIFHVLLLKKKYGDFPVATTDLTVVDDSNTLVIEPEAILNRRWVKKGSHSIEECLVKWKWLPKDDTTQENTQDIREKFGNMNLEDKVHY